MFGPSGPTLSSGQLQRFAADRRTLGDLLPRLRHYTWAGGEGAYAEGPVDVDIGAGCWEQVDIRMEFSSDYPALPPRVYDSKRRWRPELDRHIVANNEFCLWLALVDTPDVATQNGFRRFVQALVLFLHDQFVFDDLGCWPSPDWRHGPREAYAQHLVERLRIDSGTTFEALWPLVLGHPQRRDRACPCGSSLPYGRCHYEAIQSMSWIRGLRVRDDLPPVVRRRFSALA
jgi:hypothetical protein